MPSRAMPVVAALLCRNFASGCVSERLRRIGKFVVDEVEQRVWKEVIKHVVRARPRASKLVVARFESMELGF